MGVAIRADCPFLYIDYLRSLAPVVRMRVVSISLLLVCFLASPGVLCPAMVAAEQISPSEEGLDSLMFSYSILEEEVAKSYREKVEELNENYIAALEREMANVKAKGDLQGVLAIQKEIEVVQQEGAPGKEGFPGKEGMQATYSDAREAIEAEEEKALGELAAKHIVQLKSLRSALVKASKIEVAKKADAEIKRLSKTGVETERGGDGFCRHFFDCARIEEDFGQSHLLPQAVAGDV